MRTFAVRRSALLVLALGLPACSSAPREVSPHWVQAAEPKFVTLGRSTNYALVHRAGQDLLIVEDPVVSATGKKMEGRLTWIVPVPDGAKFETPIEVGGASSQAWLLEQVAGGRGHATPASGTVIIHHRDAEMLSASLHMRALGPKPTAGIPERTTIDLDRKFDFAKHVVSTPQYREMGPRSGVQKPKAE